MRAASSRVRGPAALGFVALATIVIACGSENGRGDLPESATGEKTATGSGADAGLFNNSNNPSGNTPTGQPTSETRCSDTTNALEGCGCPSDGAEAACWTGPANLRKVEQCRDGKAICHKVGEFFRWGPCDGQVLPGTNGIDAQCVSTCKGECVPGTSRYCDEEKFCAWGKQECLPNGKGGGSWGPCKETTPPAGCEPVISFPGFPPMYEEDCCKDKGFCCQVGGVNSPLSEGNCTGIVTNCK